MREIMFPLRGVLLQVPRIAKAEGVPFPWVITEPRQRRGVPGFWVRRKSLCQTTSQQYPWKRLLLWGKERSPNTQPITRCRSVCTLALRCSVALSLENRSTAPALLRFGSGLSNRQQFWSPWRSWHQWLNGEKSFSIIMSSNWEICVIW